VPRYFFDIHDQKTIRDDDGVELSGPQEAAQYAKKVLPEIAAHEMRKGGEHQGFSVLVTDEDGHPVYSAAVTYTGTWLIR
jgi:protocatechuate 3,4-dioxygenase beta subunit